MVSGGAAMCNPHAIPIDARMTLGRSCCALHFSGSYQESLSHKLGRFGALSFWSRGRRATDGGERWNLRGAIQSLGEFSQRDGCRAIVNDYRAIKRRLTIGQPG